MDPRSRMADSNDQFSLSGDRVREWRKAKGLSQSQLGELVDATSATISRLESGHRKLTPHWLSRIARALDLSPAEIASGPPRPSSSSEASALKRVVSAVEAHWLALGTDYARETFAEDLARAFPRLKL